MTTEALQAQTEGARAYDALFVPALFGQWSDLMAGKAGIAPGSRVLDVACGTGALTRQLHARLADSGHAEGLDANPGMLAVAAEQRPEITWTQAAAEALPYRPSSFDAVTCQFGLMFFSEPDLAIAEMLRVVKPGAKVVLAVWDAIESVPGYFAEHNLILERAGQQAADAVAVPFSLGDTQQLNALCVAAGARDIAIETHLGTARFPDVATMVGAELRGWLPIMGVHLEEPLIDDILGEAEHALAPFRLADGSLTFDIAAHVAVLTG